MFFWMKKTEVIVDCFTYSSFAYDYAKIDYAVKFIPDWWKETPKVFNGEATIRNCKGLIDFYKNGLILPSWFEMELNVLRKGDPERFRWIASNQDVASHGSHSSNQFLGFAEDDGVNLKIQSPWFLKTKEKINFVWSQPTWNLKKFLPQVTVLPATVNFYEQHETHINLFLQNDIHEKKFLIEPKTPLVIMHPMTDKKIKLNHHYVTEKETERISRGIMGLFLVHNAESLMSKAKRKNKFLEKINQSNSKCPFSS
jgi:hypothetical protein